MEYGFYLTIGKDGTDFILGYNDFYVCKSNLEKYQDVEGVEVTMCDNKGVILYSNCQ